MSEINEKDIMQAADSIDEKDPIREMDFISEQDLEEIVGGQPEGPTVPRVIPEEDEPLARKWMAENCNPCKSKAICKRRIFTVLGAVQHIKRGKPFVCTLRQV